MRGFIFAGLMVVALSAGCAESPSNPLQPLPQPVQRINLYGFSVQPSNNPGWVVIAQAPFALALSRRGSSSDETIALETGVLKLTDFSSASVFATEWENRENQNTDPERFTTASHDVTVVQYKGVACARSHMVVQDHAPHTVSHSGKMMILESLTLACPHPANHKIVIYLSYSQRYYPGQGNKEFIQMADSVFNSIEFTPLPLSAASDKVLQWKQVPYQTATGQILSLDLFGGERGDWSRSMVCASDDSCILFGFTSGGFSGSTDQLITHLGPKASLQWAETISGGYSDQLWHAIPATAGGFMTVGASESRFPSTLKIYSPHHRKRPLFVRLDPNGKIMWAGSVELDSDISSAEVSYVAQTTDGGYLLAGGYSEAYPESGAQPLLGVWSGAAPGKERGWEYTYPVVLKLDANGKPEWLRRYSFDNHGGDALTVTEMPSGHILVMGSIYVNQTNNLFILETDAQGVPLHAEQYELPQRLGTLALLRLKDGNYLVVGYANTNTEPHAAFSALFTPDLKLVGGAIYHDPAGLRPLGMAQGSDGKICIVGRTENPQTNQADGVAWLIAENGADLAELWLSGQGNTELESVAALPNGTYRIIGDTKAFGAISHSYQEAYDQIVTNWSPPDSNDNNPNRLVVKAFKPDVTEVKATSDTATLSVIKPIPPEAFEITPLTITFSGSN